MGTTRRVFLSSVAATLGGLPEADCAEEPSYRHPDFHPHPRIAEIFRDLAAPLHATLIRDPSRSSKEGEADLSRGCSLEIDRTVAGDLAAAADDFRRFLSVSMGLRPETSAYRLRLRRGPAEGCPANAPEAFHMRIGASDGTVVARDADGLRRALVHLEDEMAICRGPFLPLGPVSRWAEVEDRITHSPVAPYRWLSGWELEQDGDYYPDEYLNKLVHCGMNGIWVAGLLSRLVATKSLPELGPPEHRLERLRKLTDRARRYGIRVFLFCVEPRSMPRDHPVFAAHPEIRGAGGQCLCTSTPLVREYIREVMRELFAAAPGLAGVINIYKGERTTTCWTNEKLAESCPRCRTRPQVEVLTEDLNCFQEGIRQSSRTAKFLAWGYSGNRATDFRPFLARLNPEVAWLGNFEHDGEKQVHGRRVEVHEYSLSAVGPSASFAAVARSMAEAGRTAYAKLQVGNSYELSSVPYIPVPATVYDKVVAMRELKVRGSMMSWIIGGYPSMQLKVAGEACFSPMRSRDETLERAAAIRWGSGAAPRVAAAWKRFSEAFQLYLCTINAFYFGPITRCPAYHLHLEKELQTARPYNWGLTRERVRQPFEDQVARWTPPFTAKELMDSFREMAGLWNEGLSQLEAAMAGQPNLPELKREYAVAAAARIQFLSMANVIEFYTLRDRLRDAAAADQAPLVARLREVVADDIELARQMQPHTELDCTIGFESEIYDYSYSPALLEEKIRHDSRTLETLTKWKHSGVEPEVLARTLPAPPPAPPHPPDWREWLKWGD